MTSAAPVVGQSDRRIRLLTRRVQTRRLALHSQLRISSIESTFLLIPLGFPWTKIVLTFSCFYLIATPLVGTLALTDLTTMDIAAKMVLCVPVMTDRIRIRFFYSRPLVFFTVRSKT